MPEQNKPFVVTDRRRHTLDGEPRPDADPSPEREQPSPVAVMPEAPTPQPSEPAPTSESLNAADVTSAPEQEEDAANLPPLTPDQMAQAKFAYDQTADRLDTAIRAANPGMDRIPPMTFDSLVQSVYMSAIMQLGGSTAQGEQPRVDLMGARQSIDMLSVLDEKTRGNLSVPESQLLESALFELRMAFLEVTQALTRSAAAKAPQGPPMPGGPARPSIVR